MPEPGGLASEQVRHAQDYGDGYGKGYGWALSKFLGKGCGV